MVKNQNFQTLKGFRDFLGEEAQKRQWLIQKIQNTFERFGFEPLESPVLEYEELLMGKYGTEADKLIYRFEDKGGRRVAMRYDQTVPAARIISQYKQQLIFPYKKYQIQLVWRADKPQKGRYREFLQCDADIVGSSSLFSDAEILAVYFNIYKDIGVNLKLKINDRKQLIDVIKQQGIEDAMVFSVIQSIDKMDKKTPEDITQELLKKGLHENTIKGLFEKLQSVQPTESLQRIQDVAIKLGVQNDCIQFTPTLARGLDYYTGMIFEGYIPEYEGGSVGGGGRYDNLIKDLVGVDMPAVGFGLGFDRTFEAADQLGKIPSRKSSSKALVTIFSPDLFEKSLEITQRLRNSNINVECSLDDTIQLDKQLKYADRKGIPYVIIIGPEEAKQNKLILKDMKSGEQETLTVEELAEKLKKN
ncbi:histidine--tRNA ligase [Candidatus Roizmanbacteria bacterium RIFCSPHIGHO2_02_FULL_37_24]|uniref:Histidine--tRNA ligase n=1 Tax=Candidatus Roizmanbacteria bacterium RIFCSPHIGHO2_02_FULL_37_24 TaxID=1802037 RepID=A0A1F7GXS5_9BACT|nr:MAG: histidine--tRNA ligase [Candidatus Roizmanbacteria bacterium RIFCSPHIGHO2_02_FULL_37_24]OGK43344.1 MAG: histidine--tRNA ligase [Candidatus Roizmanbacteria bacterium RIFCSPLOWO2_01_FULL_37_57]